MPIKKIFLLVILAPLFQIGCSQTPLNEASATCQSTDWFERGRQDGATGEIPHTEKYQSECPRVFLSESQSLYMAGFHSGLNDYCSPENAFKIGEMGGPSENQCPKLMKEAFEQGYKKGAHSRELRNKNQQLARKIQNLSSQASSREISSVEKGSISSELAKLKRLYAQNQKRLSRMSN